MGNRYSSVMHARLRNNCSSLNNDLFINHVRHNPLCEWCDVMEDATHFFFHCIKYIGERQVFNDTVREFQSKKGCKDQESIQSSTTPDPEYQWESDKLTEDTTNESQEVSPFPAVDHEAHINRRAQNIANTRQNKNIKDPQKKYRLGTVSKIFYWRA